MKTDKQSEVDMHVWERAGLGKAPFRCVGVHEELFKMADGSVKPGGCCAYCSNGIRDVYTIVSADGNRFGVGCDCVRKTRDSGLIKSFKNNPEVRRMNRERREAKDRAITEAFKALVTANEARLRSEFVPGRPRVPGELVSRYDDLLRVWNMCGASGRKRTLRNLTKNL